MAEMPRALDPADQARWDTTALRHRLMTGKWRSDALAAEADFFTAEARDHLPPPDLSRNSYLSLNLQISTLYDVAATITADAATDPEELERLVPETWSAWQQERLRFQVGLRDVALRLDIDADPLVPAQERELSFRVVTPNFLCRVRANPKVPGQPIALTELVEREKPDRSKEWTWEVWDVSDPKAPIFQILAQRGDVLADVTADYAGSTEYPYWDDEGKPILPYVFAHARVGTALFAPDDLTEVADGTLNAAALWTLWRASIRDNCFPVTWTGNSTIQHQEVTAGKTPSQVVRLDHTAVLQLKSAPGTAVQIGRLPASGDPEKLAAAIETYELGPAASMDISAADVSRGGSQSGYALVVSRDGQRRARRRLEPLCRMADRLILVVGARLLRGHGGARTLPTTPRAYAVAYAQIERSPTEIAAEQQEIKTDLELGLISQRQALRRRNPSLTDQQLDELQAEIDADRRRVTTNPVPAGTSPQGAAP